jgi:hypothetical protein
MDANAEFEVFPPLIPLRPILDQRGTFYDIAVLNGGSASGICYLRIRGHTPPSAAKAVGIGSESQR